MPPTCLASAFTPIRMEINPDSFSDRSRIVVPETRIPSTSESRSLTCQTLSRPYWVLRGDHHSGVSWPRSPPKSDGDGHVPISTPLIQTVISDGQSRL